MVIACNFFNIYAMISSFCKFSNMFVSIAALVIGIKYLFFSPAGNHKQVKTINDTRVFSYITILLFLFFIIKNKLLQSCNKEYERSFTKEVILQRHFSTGKFDWLQHNCAERSQSAVSSHNSTRKN